jgi:Spo0E like sporulation regulatory protein.
MEIILLKRIEGLREILNNIGLIRNLIDPEVIQVSQQLDQLLNQYHRIITH